jgi:DUF1680 family protein
MFSQFLVGETEEGLSLNSLVPCSIALPERFGGARIAISGSYPLRPQAEIRFEAASEKPLSLEFRAPWGSRWKAVYLNGTQMDPDTTDRGYYRIKRSWEPGDTLRVEFDYSLKSHFQLGEEKKNWVAFTFGPMALAQELRSGTRAIEPFADRDGDSMEAQSLLERLPSAQEDSTPCFGVKGAAIELVPYFLAGNAAVGLRSYFRCR